MHTMLVFRKILHTYLVDGSYCDTKSWHLKPNTYNFFFVLYGMRPAVI